MQLLLYPGLRKLRGGKLLMITTSAQKVTIASSTHRGPCLLYDNIKNIKLDLDFHKNATAND